MYDSILRLVGTQLCEMNVFFCFFFVIGQKVGVGVVNTNKACLRVEALCRKPSARVHLEITNVQNKLNKRADELLLHLPDSSFNLQQQQKLLKTWKRVGLMWLFKMCKVPFFVYHFDLAPSSSRDDTDWKGSVSLRLRKPALDSSLEVNKLYVDCGWLINKYILSWCISVGFFGPPHIFPKFPCLIILYTNLCILNIEFHSSPYAQ